MERTPGPLTITELDLLEFFPVVPELAEPGEPWRYNDAAYRFHSVDRRGVFAIAPAYRDVRLMIETGESQIYELNATSVWDVRIHREKGAATLEVAVSAADSVFLRLTPAIAVYHRAGTQ